MEEGLAGSLDAEIYREYSSGQAIPLFTHTSRWLTFHCVANIIAYRRVLDAVALVTRYITTRFAAYLISSAAL